MARPTDPTSKKYLTQLWSRFRSLATEQVEVASVPFASFIANKNQSGDPASYSFVLRGYVRHWLDKVWAEYDRTGLLDILDARQAPRAPASKPRPVIKIAEAP